MRSKALDFLELDAVFANDKNIFYEDIDNVVKHSDPDMLEMINKLSIISESREKTQVSDANKARINEINEYKSLGSSLSNLKEALDKTRSDRTNRTIAFKEVKQPESSNYYKAYGDKQMVLRLLAELTDTDNYKISIVGDDSNVEGILNAISQKTVVDNKSVWMLDRTREDELKF